MWKLVSNQICPNFTFKDALFTLKQVTYLKTDKNIDFSKPFGTSEYHLLNTARSGLGLLAKNLDLPKEKRIGIPAFICGVVATPFLQEGYKIEWIDTDKNGCISFEDFTKKSKNISLLICPHIFGQVINLRNFYEYCQKENIILVEDCAHHFELGEHEQNYDFRIHSFGREKVLSCVSGGALLWNKNSQWSSKISHIKIPGKLSIKETLKHLIQPMVFSLSLPWWKIGGKIIPWFFMKIKALPKAVTVAEKNGKEDISITSLPYPLQRVLDYQIKKNEDVITHRKEASDKWKNVLSKIYPTSEVKIPGNYFRIILKTNSQKEIIAKANKNGFFLRDWDGVPISPNGVHLEKFGYTKGQCSNAETFAQSHVTFPTNIRTTTKDILKYKKSL